MENTKEKRKRKHQNKQKDKCLQYFFILYILLLIRWSRLKIEKISL